MIIESIIKSKGYLEIQAGVYLNDAEHLIAAQKYWPEEDILKHTDFTQYKYYISDDSLSVKGVDSVEEGLLEIIGIEACRKFLGE